MYRTAPHDKVLFGSIVVMSIVVILKNSELEIQIDVRHLKEMVDKMRVDKLYKRMIADR